MDAPKVGHYEEKAQDQVNDGEFDPTNYAD